MVKAPFRLDTRTNGLCAMAGHKMGKVMEFFDRTAIMAILDIPLTRVKNWSTGRPLRIEPTVRVARKRGAVNLYSRGDVYRFAVAQGLSLHDFQPDLIREVLDHPASHDLSRYGLLYIAWDAPEKVRFLPGYPNTQLVLTVAIEFVEGRISDFYALNLVTLVEKVDARIKAYTAARQ